MNIAAIGTQEQTEELRKVLSPEHSFQAYESNKIFQINITPYDVVFDLEYDQRPEEEYYYTTVSGKTIFLSSAKIQLEEYIKIKHSNTLIGINALPTFLGRKKLEACSPFGPMPVELIKKLGWDDVMETGSRTGMVSPRIVCMIINEAFYTLQEGTATKEDIDKGMKLGTAYPYGPFEWCDKIGIRNVYEVLNAVWEDTRDERYRICSLLKTSYLKSLRK